MDWKFEVGHRFVGDEIDVVVDQCVPADLVKGWVPAYHLSIRLRDSDQPVGQLRARIGYTDSLVKYAGHIGYGVDEPFRGHRYAARGCRLIGEIFQAHGMDVIWITNDPDNWASRRTCEILGCTLVEIVDIPPDHDMYAQGKRRACRYRWVVY